MPKARIKQLIKHEMAHLLSLNPAPRSRPWHLILTSALTVVSTIFIGVLLDNMQMGVLASLGAMIILNQPASGNLRQRQGLLLMLAVVMVASFALGLVAHNLASFRFPIFALITFCMVFMSRYLSLPPPGGMFIMMASVIAIFMPVGWADIPLQVAIVALGALYAWCMGLLYNLLVVRPSIKASPPRGNYEKGMLTESIIVTSFVVLSLEIALWLQMPYPYWVPVSCFVIMQGTHLRSIWIKQLHRILGTGVGVFVAWFLLSLHLSNIGIVMALFLMFIWIETIIVRHYALAVVMVTPLTVFIAEYGRGSHSSIAQASDIAYRGIIQARFLDTVLGCTIALIGGLVMHSKWFRQPLMRLEAHFFK